MYAHSLFMQIPIQSPPIIVPTYFSVDRQGVPICDV